MILAEQRFSRSEKSVWEAGFLALIQALGYADALRFLGQINSGQGDYLEWQERVFGEADVGEIYNQAQQHWKERQE